MSDTGVYGAARWKELSATGRMSECSGAPGLLHPHCAIPFKLRVARSLLQTAKTQKR
jgi:hypothetical protein